MPVSFDGLFSIPTVGAKRTRYLHPLFKAIFYKNTAKGRTRETIEAVADSSETLTGRSSSDLINLTTNKVLTQPAGSYALTLVPRQYDYFDILDPGDWCSIQVDNGDGFGFRDLMYGPIATLQRQKAVDNRGAVRIVVSISGSDFGKVLASTVPIYDTKLASDGTFTNLGLGAIVNSLKAITGSASSIIKALTELYLTALEQWYDPRTNKTFGRGTLDYDYLAPSKQLLGEAILEPITLSEGLWQVLQQWANASVNELFVDYRPPFKDPNNRVKLVPAIILRQYPFWGTAWNNLPMVNIEHDEVNDETLVKSDSDVKNWIRALDEPRITGDAQGIQMYQKNAGVVNTESVKVFGFRRHEMTTQFVMDTRAYTENREPKSIPSVVFAHSAVQALWHHSNEKLQSGSLRTYFRPEARVGYRALLNNAEEDRQTMFYIEGVNHSCSFPGVSTTSLTLTRGRDPKDPLFNYDVETLKQKGVLQELGFTITESLEQLAKVL